MVYVILLLQQQQYIMVDTMIVIAQNGKIVPRIIPNKALLEVPSKIMKLIKSFKELTIKNYSIL